MSSGKQRIVMRTPEGGIEEHIFTGKSISIGKAGTNNIIIKGWAIGKKHAEIVTREHGLFIQTTNPLIGVSVNGARVKEFGPLKSKDEIQIGDYSIFVLDNNRNDEASGLNTSSGRPSVPEAVPEQALAAAVPDDQEALEQALKALRKNTGNGKEFSSSDSEAVTRKESVQTQKVTDTAESSAEVIQTDPYLEWRKKVHEALIKMMDVRRTDITTMSEPELRAATQLMIDVVMQSMQDLPRHIDKTRLANQVLDETVGLGPLEPLIKDESVSEIMVNAYDQIFIERAGRIVRSDVFFTNNKAVLAAIERIVSPLGRKIDESSPMVDGRLKDGSRVNAVIPPIALKGPCISIRKFSTRRLYGEDLIKFGTLNEGMLEFLSFSVRQAQNVIISGGTGSGKTTLLNILSNFIPDTERIVTVEDAAELRLHQPNLVTLEARPSNSEGKGAIPIRDLVKNCLRMRPDRIVVGECRGGEALDMLQAMNTGHDGSLTTAHANSARDMLSRLEVMVLMAGMDLPITAIREQIASAINLIVQQTRFKCGSRKITAITEVTGVEGGKIQLQDIFVYRQDGYHADGKVKGDFVATGAVPEFIEQLRAAGIETPPLSIFAAPDQYA